MMCQESHLSLRCGRRNVFRPAVSRLYNSADLLKLPDGPMLVLNVTALCWTLQELGRREVCVKRKRHIEPKQKVETPASVGKTSLAQGSRETTRAMGGAIIIVGKHIAKMWEANRTTGK